MFSPEYQEEQKNRILLIHTKVRAFIIQFHVKHENAWEQKMAFRVRRAPEWKYDVV